MKEDVVMKGRNGIERVTEVRVFLWLLTAAGLLWAAGCGGNSGGETAPPPPTTYTIGGSVSGLSGTGLVLQDNGGDSLSITSNGSFTFSTAINSGGAYKVTVLTQPSGPAQNCVVTSGGGTASANVTSVQVACTTTTFTIGGSVSGLLGTGLVLQDNGGDNLSITGNGTFTFATGVDSGAAYKVTVLTEPTGPSQTCAVANGSGNASASVTNVQVACSVGYTIGGTISGLTGTGLVLQDNGGDNLTITGNGSFTFATALTSGSSYDVTVLTQPSSPSETCALTDGTGKATANIANISISCAPQMASEWTWESGSDTGNPTGTYGTLGKSSSSNFPGARLNPVSWTDSSGNLWLFGGAGYGSTSTYGQLNDLWEYSGGDWTWVTGANVINQVGVYGAEGTASASNVPGARTDATGWTDANGNFWLFGGQSVTSAYTWYFSDLWEYSKGEWTWVSGSNSTNEAGTYGTLGTPSSSNVPGARRGAVHWIDSSGNLWLFGGINESHPDLFNDLWKYRGGQWTWMGGSNGSNSQAGVYGSKGVAAAGNFPGARVDALSWTDPDGNFWLFGGLGDDSVGSGVTYLNDLWEYSGGKWTWVSGSNIGSQTGTYGTEGMASADNTPGGRYDAVGWVDSAGNLYLFGGTGLNATSTTIESSLNDFWEFSGGQWTWLSGSSSGNVTATYGTEGTPAPGNDPGARVGATAWTDPQGNFWLFGGQVYTPTLGYLGNDLWKYGP